MARTPTALPSRILLEQPGQFLQAIGEAPFSTDLDRVEIAQIFSLVGLATLSRRNGDGTSETLLRAVSNAARFAHAVGFEDVVTGKTPDSPGQAGRTVKMRRITRFEEIEHCASEIAHLILPDDEDSRRTLQYVVVELLRNVVQHSRDPLGGVVAAQRMDERQQYPTPYVQVSVADAGIGIFEALHGMHPAVESPRQALVKALEPYISGTFEEHLSGSAQNAGMGLFFVSEMAKLTSGRLLIASRGASLLLHGDVENHKLEFVQPEGVGFPGTLVAFEFPLGGVFDYDGLIHVIKERGKERAPRRAVHQWLRYETPPSGVPAFLVRFTSEDTAASAEFARTKLEPRILARQPFALDFRGVDVCTQSYLHALLFEVLRLAWARRIPIYIVNVAPAVRSGLDLLESYGLGG